MVDVDWVIICVEFFVTVDDVDDQVEDCCFDDVFLDVGGGCVGEEVGEERFVVRVEHDHWGDVVIYDVEYEGDEVE